MKNKISDLNDHLFETIEMLKSNSDPKASKNEKIDLETAKCIANVGKVIIDGAKVQVQALELISKTDYLTETINAVNKIGILELKENKQLSE